VWKVYLEFIQHSNVPEMAVRVYRRYLKLEPTRVEEYIDYLLTINRRNEAASRLAEALNNEKFASIRGKTYHQLWMELTDLCSKYPAEIQGINAERIIRSGIEKFADQRGKLWTSLADYFIRLQQFEQARNVFEEGIADVQTVRDFTQIFDVYAKFEESIINQKMVSSDSLPILKAKILQFHHTFRHNRQQWRSIRMRLTRWSSILGWQGSRISWSAVHSW